MVTLAEIVIPLRAVCSAVATWVLRLVTSAVTLVVMALITAGDSRLVDGGRLFREVIWSMSTVIVPVARLILTPPWLSGCDRIGATTALRLGVLTATSAVARGPSKGILSSDVCRPTCRLPTTVCRAATVLLMVVVKPATVLLLKLTPRSAIS